VAALAGLNTRQNIADRGRKRSNSSPHRKSLLDIFGVEESIHNKSGTVYDNYNKHCPNKHCLGASGSSWRVFLVSSAENPAPDEKEEVNQRRQTAQKVCRPFIIVYLIKLDASVALAASGALPENVNYAVKSSLLLSFLESVPDVANKLKAPNTADEKFEEVVRSAQGAAVLVLVY
jgi:hypothetical protein